MSSLSPTRTERIRTDLLHFSLRQVTEDPEPGQPANLARRSASFKKNRQDLDNHQLRKAAERAAADKRKDDALRVKLNSVAGTFHYFGGVSPLILIYPVDTRSRLPLQAAQEVTTGTARRLGADKCTTRNADLKARPILTNKTDSPSTSLDKPKCPTARTR
jgi:hypothetical protein